MNKFLSALVLPLLFAGNALAFSDIQITSPLYMPTTYLSAKNIIGGYDDGSYKPQNIINRAEALKLILVATDKEIEAVTTSQFGDVPAGAWFAKYVSYAANQKIVSGDDTTGMFAPDRVVNRAEFLKMLTKSFDIDTSKYVLNVKSNDVPEEAWFAPYVNFAVKFEIMEKNSEGNALPDNGITRGEAAQMIFRILKKGQGLDPQKLLELTEAHLVKTLEYVESDNLLAAGFVVSMAESFSNVVAEIPAVSKNPVVLGSVSTAQALKHLVGAYSAGKNGRVDDVVLASKSAWKAADEAFKLNPTNEVMTNKIKLLATGLANQAREVKEASAK